jgi:hypothetical protein
MHVTATDRTNRFPLPQHLPKHTPWGGINHAEVLTPGITFISTPGHGGYHLDRCHQSVVQEILPQFRPYAGPPWYEEDQDWAIVALAFPSLFEPVELRHAVRTVRLSARYERERGQASNYVSVEAWLDSPVGAPILAAVALWEAQHAEEWEAGSCVTGGAAGCLWVNFTRVKDRAQRACYVPNSTYYDHGPLYTADELDGYRQG